MDPDTLNPDINKILERIERHFGVQAVDLKAAMGKVGRRLPRSAHRNAKVLIDAQIMAQNPKLARQIDPADLQKPYDSLLAAIEAYDRADARKGMILGALGSFAFNILLLFTLLVILLRWRGFL